MPEGDLSLEHVLLPPHMTLHCLPWSHVFEIARIWGSAMKAEDRANLDLGAIAAQAKAISNPAGLFPLVDWKAYRRPPITTSIKRAFDMASAEGRLVELQSELGYSLVLDHHPLEADQVQWDLKPPGWCKANVLNRTYGADLFLQVKLTDRLISRLRSDTKDGRKSQQAVKAIFSKPWRIAYRLYHVLIRKENMIWLVSPKDGSDWVSMKHFYNDILDLGLNQKMTIAKWVARTTLLLSATRQTITFDPNDIRRVPDLYTDTLVISELQMSMAANNLGLNYLPSTIQGTVKGKPATWRVGQLSDDKRIELWDCQLQGSQTHAIIKFQAYRYHQSQKNFVLEGESFVIPLKYCVNKGTRPKSENMSDGAAAISRAAANKIFSSLPKVEETLPSVYQGRIGYAKDDQTDWIEICDSQWKANVGPGYKFHFNLCRHSRPVKNARLGKQLIPMLASRGVPNGVLCGILEEIVQATIRDLNTNDPVRLAHTIKKMSALVTMRKTVANHLTGIRHNPSTSRVFKDGIVNPISHTSKRLREYDTIDHCDVISLAPRSYEEQVIQMLSSGFMPRNRYLIHKLRKVKDNAIQNVIKFKIPIAESASVYVMPDPTGSLKEDEAFIQFSKFRDPTTNIKISSLVGPALINRSPCAAPIDIRKVQLVDNEELRRIYYDVLVCSIQGHRSLLSILSGGDYDGDQVQVIWDQRLVTDFRNANLEDYPGLKEEDYFESVQVGTVENYLLAPYKNDSRQFVREAQRIQLAGLFLPHNAGTYSLRQAAAEYTLGLDHPLTYELGEIYVKCLDAPKKGITLKTAQDQALSKRFQDTLSKLIDSEGNKVPFNKAPLPLPKWQECVRSFNQEGSSSVFFKFSREGRPHVMDGLRALGEEYFNRYKSAMRTTDEVTHKDRAGDRDRDLDQYYAEMKNKFEPGKDESSAPEIWFAVLRPLQEHMHVLSHMKLKLVESSLADRDQDLILRSEFGTTGTARHDSKKEHAILSKYQEFNHQKAVESIEKNLQGRRLIHNLEESKMRVEAFLYGLGPIGYSRLKASCLAFCSNSEAFLPYILAFREICYLKAQACRNRDLTVHLGRSRLGTIKTQRAPHTITARFNLCGIVQKGAIRRRQDQEENTIRFL